MTDKITLTNLPTTVSVTTSGTTINANNAIIQTAFDNTLSRDGTQPNPMLSSLDMNSNHVLNLPAPAGPTEPMRLVDFNTITNGGTFSALPVGGGVGTILTKNSGTNYDVSWQNPVATLPNPSSFGGRLTLISGQPVMQSDVSGGQTLWLAPYIGKTTPVYNGSSWITSVFTSNSTDTVGASLALAGSSNWAAGTLHDVFGAFNSGSFVIGTRAWDTGMSPTTTLISPFVTTTFGGSWSNASNAFNGTTSQNSATSATLAAAPNGFSTNGLGQDWGVGVTNIISQVVIYAPSDSTILGDSPAVNDFAIFGSNDNTNWHLLTIWRGNDSINSQVFTIPISLTEQQPYRYHRVGLDGNGINSVRVAQIQFFKNTPAAAGRRLTLQDGILVNDAAMTLRLGSLSTISVPQSQGTYLGSIRIDSAAPGQISANITYGPSRNYGIWNYYNRKPIKVMAGTYYGGGSLTGAYNNYTPNSSQFWNECESGISGSSFHMQILSGVAEEWIDVDLTRSIALNSSVAACSYECGIAVDTLLNFSGTQGSANLDNTGSAQGFLPRAWASLPPFAGTHTIYAIERQGNSGTGAQSAPTGPRATCLTATWMG